MSILSPERFRKIYRDTIAGHVPARHWIFEEGRTRMLAWRDPVDGALTYIGVAGYDSFSGYAAEEAASKRLAGEVFEEVMSGLSPGNIHPSEITVHPAELERRGVDDRRNRQRTLVDRAWKPTKALPAAASRIVDAFAERIDLQAVLSSDQDGSFGPENDELVTEETLDERDFEQATYDGMTRITGTLREIADGWHYLLITRDQADLPPRRQDEGPLQHAGRIWNKMNRVEDAPSPELLTALELVRGALFDGLDLLRLRDAVAFVADLPPEWLPPRAAEAPAEWEAIGILADFVVPSARSLGRRPRDLVQGYSGSWKRLLIQVLLSDPMFGDPAAALRAIENMDSWDLYRLSRGVFKHAADMVSAFEKEVLYPALWRAGWRHGPVHSGGDDAAIGDPGEPVRNAALRLLMGEKKLTAFVESAARWTSHTTAIAETVIGLAADAELSWKAEPVPFSMPHPEGGSVEVVLLTSAQELLDDGREGIDASGMAGLDHCVASYLDEARHGFSAIVSVRRHLPDGTTVRLSTAEIRPKYEFVERERPHIVACVQHSGYGNSRPDAAAEVAIARFVEVVNAEIVARHDPDDHNRSHKDKLFVDILAEGYWDTRPAYPGTYDPDVPGSVESVLEQWRFALRRGDRAASPAELLEAGGLTPAALAAARAEGRLEPRGAPRRRRR